MIFEIFMEWFKRFIYKCNCIGLIIYISEYYIIQIICTFTTFMETIIKRYVELIIKTKCSLSWSILKQNKQYKIKKDRGIKYVYKLIS